jgi:hypothetical protein
MNWKGYGRKILFPNLNYRNTVRYQPGGTEEMYEKISQDSQPPWLYSSKARDENRLHKPEQRPPSHWVGGGSTKLYSCPTGTRNGLGQWLRSTLVFGRFPVRILTGSRSTLMIFVTFFSPYRCIPSTSCKPRPIPSKSTYHSTLYSNSKLLSGFPFIGHENPDNNLKSLCML